MNRKVFENVEQIVLAIYVMFDKPYANQVQAIYNNFLNGKIDILDESTGKMFDRADFENENKQPIKISEATVWNFINDSKKRIIVNGQNREKQAHETVQMH
jgi:ABC-type oligopeptide transport system substrate-binding subunit